MRRLIWGIQRRHIVITEITIAKAITETTRAITEATITKAEPERSAANRTPNRGERLDRRSYWQRGEAMEGLWRQSSRQGERQERFGVREERDER